ncbi:MAG: hypothetical protein R3345_08980, partial [Fulvivirga sp.]|nr:hypothetical protein [Fulvivirga sp.]
MMKIILMLVPVMFYLSCFGQERQIFDLNMEEGYKALGSANYDRSIKFFSEAQKSSVLKRKKEENLKMYVDELVKLTHKRKALGTIKPKYTHRAMVLYINNVDFEYQDNNKKV